MIVSHQVLNSRANLSVKSQHAEAICRESYRKTDSSSKTLFFTQFHVALVQVAFWMNVWLVFSALCLTDVNVCEPELVLQATYFTKPVLVGQA